MKRKSTRRKRRSRSKKRQSPKRRSRSKKRRSPKRRSRSKKSKNMCIEHVKFSGESIKILKSLLNKKTEYSGSMYIKQKSIYIKKSKIKKGDVSETDSIDHRYTFHVHPRVAYIHINTEMVPGLIGILETDGKT